MARRAPPPPPAKAPKRTDKPVSPGDALAFYPVIRSGEVDLLTTDVPFNLEAGANIAKDGREFVKGAGAYDRVPYDLEAHASSWGRLMGESGVVVAWCSDKQLSPLHELLTAAGADATQTLVWHLTNPTPVIRRSRLLSAAQFAVIARWPGPVRLIERWLGQDAKSHNVWEGPGAVGRERLILAVDSPDGDRKLIGQKPLWLARKVAALFGLPGGTAFDPHAGTGALLCGAVDVGMDVMGCELRPWWAEAASKRITKHTAESMLGRVARQGAQT